MYELEILQTIIKLETTDNTTITDEIDTKPRQLLSLILLKWKIINIQNTLIEHCSSIICN